MAKKCAVQSAEMPVCPILDVQCRKSGQVIREAKITLD